MASRTEPDVIAQRVQCTQPALPDMRDYDKDSAFCRTHCVSISTNAASLRKLPSAALNLLAQMVKVRCSSSVATIMEWNRRRYSGLVAKVYGACTLEAGNQIEARPVLAFKCRCHAGKRTFL